MATSRFQLHDSDDEGDLPFPEPLPRSVFLDPNFSPTELLSSLTSRHQTLHDLRAELSTRSQAIASELLTLVNSEYRAFLGLGQDLRGGGDKVEEVKVGVLAYQKGVQGLSDGVAARLAEVDGLVRERENVHEQISLGRALLAMVDQIEDLEGSLAIGDDDAASAVWSDDSDAEDVDATTVSVVRLTRLVHAYVDVRDQIEQLGADQPLLKSLDSRIRTIRQTLLIDLGSALKQAKGQKEPGSRVVNIMGLYSAMDAVADALRLLKTLKS